MNTRLYPCDVDVLETLILLDRAARYEVKGKSGYPYDKVDLALSKLKKLAMVELVAGLLQGTEKGKIILAILKGKQARARLKTAAE